MKSMQEIREDLKEIRYYYAKQKMFDNAAKIIGHGLLEKVDRYNKAMGNAPAKLIEIYYTLYVLNNTQAAVSYDWDITTEAVKQLNHQLCEYLQGVLD